MANKAYTIRLNPTTEQEQQLKQTAGAARWLWNQSLNATKQNHKKTGKFLFQYDLNKQIPELRKQNDWLKEINSQVLQQKNRDLDTALKQSFKTHGFPKFKCKHKNNDSFRVPQHFQLSNKGVKLPKIGWIKWKPNRKLVGKAKSVTIKQDLDNWIAIVLCEIPDIQVRTAFAESEVVGIDVGIKDFAVLSNGIKITNPNHLTKSEKLLKRKQKKLFKKVKGSQNRNKAKKSVAKLHRHISNQRKDFQWKQVAEITNQFSVICMEDLNIKGMVKNRKLSKYINSAGWGLFKNKIRHKLAESGGLLVDIDRFAPSTKMCQSCGALNDNLTLKDREWDCNCGAHHDRDINAAINIRSFGLNKLNRLGTSRIYACGETTDGEPTKIGSSYVSMKQENLVIGPEAAESLVRR